MHHAGNDYVASLRVERYLHKSQRSIKPMSATTMILRLTTDGHERQDAQHRTIMSGDMRRNGLEASQAVAVRHPNIARSGPVMAEPSSAQAAQEKGGPARAGRQGGDRGAT
jgi:hypothetical protein